MKCQLPFMSTVCDRYAHQTEVIGMLIRNFFGKP